MGEWKGIYFARNMNLAHWMATGGDYDLLERCAYFAEVRYPGTRRYTEGERPSGQRRVN